MAAYEAYIRAQTSQFRSPLAAQEIPEYQSVSTLAVISLVLGLASVLALAAPILLAIPVAAAGAALVALGSIRRSAGRVVGERIARWGLFTALVFGVCAVVREPVRYAVLNQQAVEAVEQWVSLLADSRYQESFDRLSPTKVARLQPQVEPGGVPPSPLETREHMLQRIKVDPLVQRLAEFSPDVDVTYEGRLSTPSKTGSTVTLQNLYQVDDRASPRPEPLRVRVEVVQNPTYESNGLSLRIQDWALDGVP